MNEEASIGTGSGDIDPSWWPNNDGVINESWED